MQYKPPFPWFGGKSLVADLVWGALGDVDNYVEPFAGSLAVLMLRPEEHAGYCETVNDVDLWIVNFWRAVRADPEAVAHYADNPVNEADLTARHIWLVNTGRERIARLQGDPDWYDAKVAGWWVWGICCWIGSGWCSGKGPWGSEGGQLVHLGNAGQGVNRQRVQLGSMGLGVNRKREGLVEYMQSLADRLRYVRVCCGDWARVVTDGALSHGTTVGVFLDPPYALELRKDTLYNTDADHGDVSGAVREWALENGHNPRYRIVLAGYEGEHAMPDDWRCIKGKAGRAYGNSNGDSANSENRHKERLWLSPNCIGRTRRHVQPALFGEADND